MNTNDFFTNYFALKEARTIHVGKPPPAEVDCEAPDADRGNNCPAVVGRK